MAAVCHAAWGIEVGSIGAAGLNLLQLGLFGDWRDIATSKAKRVHHHRQLIKRYAVRVCAQLARNRIPFRFLSDPACQRMIYSDSRKLEFSSPET